MSTTENNRLFVGKKDKIIFCENNLVSLVLENGQQFEKLEPRRLFPVNMPDRYITLLSSDGDEVAVIKELSDLEEESRKVIIQSLSDYYIIPRIIKIVSVSDKFGTLHWGVETDKGYKEFDIRNRYHGIKSSESGVVRIRDVDDNRYIIENYHTMDKHSKSALVAYI